MAMRLFRRNSAQYLRENLVSARSFGYRAVYGATIARWKFVTHGGRHREQHVKIR